MKRMSLIIMILVISSVHLHSESMVWVAEKGGEVVYLGGTIHFLRKSDHPLPEEFLAAYNAADILFLEADIGSMNNLEFQQKIQAVGWYEAGEGLDKILSEEAYDSLITYCERAGIPAANINKFKPPLILLVLLSIELGKMGVSVEYGIDMFFYRLALGEGKDIIYFETIDEQLEHIMSMGVGYESEMVLNSLSEMTETRNKIEEMILCWKAGDEKRVNDLLMRDLKRDYPRIFQSLIVDRNAEWMPEIEALFLTEEDEFVLVGAGHLVGEEGIVAQLRERGYTVKKLE